MQTSNDAQLQFDGIGLNSAYANTDTALASDTPEKILVSDGVTALRAVVAQNNQSIAVIEDNNNLAPNAFFGDNSGLNFSDYRGEVNINLADGAGNDKLIGKGDSADKDGSTTFFFFAGDGRDVISNFEFITPENRNVGIDDKISASPT